MDDIWKSKRRLKVLVKIGLIIAILLFFIFTIPSTLFYYYSLRFIYTLFPFLLEIRVLLFCVVLGVTLPLVLYFSRRIKSEHTCKHATFKQDPKLLSCLMVSLLIILLFGELFAPIIILQPVDSKIDAAILRAKSLLYNASIELVVRKITDFVDDEVRNSYNRPESAFEIDNFLSPLDYYVLNILGFERAHIIVFQGWGSCGQYAIVTEYMLRNLGFSSRRAKFIDRDHEWAEVYINGTWFIVDPWFIAHSFNNSVLVQAQILATADKFKDSKGVIVIYPNGTQVDETFEHGYDIQKP